MADTLIAGTTLVEKESRSIGDVPVGGITEWNDTFGNLPDGYVLCDGSTINDPLSAWNATAVQDLNTEYLMIPGSDFISISPSSKAVTTNGFNGTFRADADTITIHAPVNLPTGVSVTEAIIYGNAGATAESWNLYKNTSSTGANDSTLASANIGSADSSITNPIIDNETFNYSIQTSTIDTNDEVWGARITYTPRNKFIMRVR